MHRNTCIAVVFVSSFVFLNSAKAGSYDSSNFTSAGRAFQSAPTGHISGKDNGPGIGTHGVGEDCGICHRETTSSTPGKASKYLFTMAGTLYEDKGSTRPLKGGEVILQDINGKVISMTSNEVGNFWTYEPIGSNPYTIAGHGTVAPLYTTDSNGNLVTPTPVTDTRSWQYKTWVKNGDHVIPMVTIAPVGGGSDGTSRMGCSMHHSPMGTRGGLWASTKGTLPSYPESGLSFKKHILPIFMSKCVSCHMPGAAATRIVTKTDLDSPNTRIDYSGGVDLTSYNGSTIATTDGITPGTKKGVKDVVNKLLTTNLISNNNSSPLMHAGGGFWSEIDADYKAIKQWIAEGAQNN